MRRLPTPPRTLSPQRVPYAMTDTGHELTLGPGELLIVLGVLPLVGDAATEPARRHALLTGRGLIEHVVGRLPAWRGPDIDHSWRVAQDIGHHVTALTDETTVHTLAGALRSDGDSGLGRAMQREDAAFHAGRRPPPVGTPAGHHHRPGDVTSVYSAIPLGPRTQTPGVPLETTLALAEDAARRGQSPTVLARLDREPGDADIAAVERVLAAGLTVILTSPADRPPARLAGHAHLAWHGPSIHGRQDAVQAWLRSQGDARPPARHPRDAEFDESAHQALLSAPGQPARVVWGHPAALDHHVVTQWRRHWWTRHPRPVQRRIDNPWHHWARRWPEPA